MHEEFDDGMPKSVGGEGKPWVPLNVLGRNLEAVFFGQSAVVVPGNRI